MPLHILDESQVARVLKLLEEAGDEILRIYHAKDYHIKIKEDDSPVTRADLASDRIIKAVLTEITPGIGIFSEETKDIDYNIRSKWDPLWILDPLDGTKEFIAGNDEFCISLALVLEHKPVAGFIYAPVTRETWIAIKGDGAFKIAEGKKIRLPFLTPSGAYRVNISRSHHSDVEENWINKLREKHEVVIALYGSAIKFCKIAEGICDVYPKFSRIHEWDVAAGHLIIEEAGGVMIEKASRLSPVYNKESYFQDGFVAFGKRVRNWNDFL
jgi:3'(2'), 5'-bisphosphate nucleotidase